MKPEILKSWINQAGDYFETAKQPPDTVSCPKRPTHFHKWVNGVWTLDLVAYKIQAINDKRAAEYRAKRAAAAQAAQTLPLPGDAVETAIVNATTQAAVDAALK